MDNSQFVIIGAYGQLGKALQARFPDAQAVDRDQLDITNLSALQAFDWSNIRVILNAAAYTNVDGAETSDGRELAWNINATAVGHLARIAVEHGITLVHISSDYVFSLGDEPRREDTPFAPLGAYGSTKAAGDIAAATTPQHYILRTSWLIGDGPNFVRTMLSLAARGISPKVVGDQVGRLTFTHTLVDAIETLLQNEAPYGTYNVTNGGEPASWADIAKSIFVQTGASGQVESVTTAEYFAGKPEAAPRPLNSVFDLGKIQAAGLSLTDWREELNAYVRAEQTANQESTEGVS